MKPCLERENEKERGGEMKIWEREKEEEDKSNGFGWTGGITVSFRRLI